MWQVLPQGPSRKMSRKEGSLQMIFKIKNINIKKLRTIYKFSMHVDSKLGRLKASITIENERIENGKTIRCIKQNS